MSAQEMCTCRRGQKLPYESACADCMEAILPYLRRNVEAGLISKPRVQSLIIKIHVQRYPDPSEVEIHKKVISPTYRRIRFTNVDHYADYYVDVEKVKGGYTLNRQGPFSWGEFHKILDRVKYLMAREPMSTTLDDAI